MKRKNVIVLLLIFSLVFTACSSSGGKNMKKVGIIQFAQHASLDNCRIGIIKGLEDKGFVDGKNIEIDYQNGDADTGVTGQIVDKFVKNKYDMIIAIATPAAMSAYNRARDSDISVVYSAINDPIESKLANEDGSSKGNVTGTSDALPIENQLKMIREILPDAKKLGILFTTSESNSLSNIKIYESLVGKYGFELVTESINQTSDIALATDTILSKVDCLTNITDNTVVNSLPTILNKANEKKIPIFGSEIEQVKKGCLASEGIEYVSLGERTGQMAASILKGEKKASEMKYETIEGSNLYINDEVSKNLSIKISKELKDRAVEIFDSISNK